MFLGRRSLDKEERMLTEREIEVLGLLQKGLKQREIAKKLEVSEPSITVFKQKALLKIKASVEVLRIARELGLEIPK